MLTKPPIVIDTCVLSNYYSGNAIYLLKKLYANNLIIPSEVVKECIKYGPLKVELKRLGSEDWYNIYSINDLDELLLYSKIEKRCKGAGESAVLTIAQIKYGTACSDNLSDIGNYIREKNIPLMTTCTILYEGFKKEIITFKQGERIIQDMIDGGRHLVVDSFKDIVDSFEGRNDFYLI